MRSRLILAALLLATTRASASPEAAPWQQRLTELAAAQPQAQLVELGQSVEARPILALSLGPTGAPRPLLVLAGLRGGPDAAATGIAELATHLSAASSSDGGVLLIPCLNPDGAARWPQGLAALPTRQDDPDGRLRAELQANAQGLDLADDLLSLCSPEARALREALRGARAVIHLRVETSAKRPRIASLPGLTAQLPSGLLGARWGRAEDPKALRRLALFGLVPIELNLPGGAGIGPLVSLTQAARSLLSGAPTRPGRASSAGAWVIPGERSDIASWLRAQGLTVERLGAPLRVNARRMLRGPRAGQPRRVDGEFTIDAGELVVRAEPCARALQAALFQLDGGLAAERWEMGLIANERLWDWVEGPLAGAVLEPVEARAPSRRLTLEGTAGTWPARLTWGSGSAGWHESGLLRLDRPGRGPILLDPLSGALARPPAPERIPFEALTELPGGSAEDLPELRRAPRWSAGTGRWVVSWGGDLYALESEPRAARRLTFDPGVEERLVEVAPGGRIAGFVKGHDLWMVDLEAARSWPLTRDGSEDILNGELDWVTQEELFGRGRFRAFWFSPDGAQVAFLRLDQRRVPTVPIVDHGRVEARLEAQRYPRAGDPLARTSLGLARVRGGEVRWLDEAAETGLERLIARVDWRPSGGMLTWQRLDRRQTWLELCAYEPAAKAQRVLLREESETWVEAQGAPHWLGAGSFLWLSERSGYRHLERVTLGAEVARAPLTSGAWSVARILQVTKDEVVFQAARERLAERGLWRLTFSDGALARLTPAGWDASGEVSPCGRWLIATESRFDEAPEQSLIDREGRRLRRLTPARGRPLEDYALAAPRWLSLKTRDGASLSGMLLTPPESSAPKPWPLLVKVYGGPQAQTVRDAWRGGELWHRYLTQQGVAVLAIDNRSASGRGPADARGIYKRLGAQELADVEDAVRQLVAEGLADEARVGIWGWSYGGYLTSYALTHSKLFKLGIAGAPVTDWRSYDAIYTERYMGLPAENVEGYAASSVVEAASQLSGRLLIIHGTLDDNVHLTNSIRLLDALQRAQRPAELLLYPGGRHGLRDRAQWWHLRQRMTRFILEGLARAW